MGGGDIFSLRRRKGCRIKQDLSLPLFTLIPQNEPQDAYWKAEAKRGKETRARKRCLSLCTISLIFHSWFPTKVTLEEYLLLPWIFSQDKGKENLWQINQPIPLLVMNISFFGPVVSNHGSLRDMPAPVARNCHGPPDHRYMPNGPWAWHMKGEGGHGRGPWQWLGGRRVRGQGEPKGRGRAGRPQKYYPVGREGIGTSTVVRGKGGGGVRRETGPTKTTRDQEQRKERRA